MSGTLTPYSSSLIPHSLSFKTHIMFDLDKWNEIFSTIRRHKLRTMLTAFSVWWGIFMLVILLGAGKGLENSATHDFQQDALATLYVWSDETSIPYQGLPVGRRLKFDNGDYQVVDDMEESNKTSARYWLSGEFFVAYKGKSRAYRVESVYPEHLHVELPKIVEGRFLNDADINKLRKVVVIGKVVRDEFFKSDEEALGKYLNIKGTEYKVVGVFTEERRREMERVYLPITTMQRIDGTDRVNTIIVEMGDVTFDESEQIAMAVRQKLAGLHRVDPTDKKAIGIWNDMQNFQDANTVLSMIRIFIWFVGIGSIIAGVIGVSNIMLIIVKERTREIGIRKALGATPGSIVALILQESIFLTSIAGYVGMISGLTIIYAIQQFMIANNIEAEFFRNPEVDMPTVFAALFVVVFSGALAGLIPAIQAVKINPVVAMKS